MGVIGLASLFLNNPDLLETFELHNSTVIFDGRRLMDFIYHSSKIDYVFGGEYQQYADNVRDYMSSFLQCNIKPIVIIDSGYEKAVQKIKSVIPRGNDTIKLVHSITKNLKSTNPVYPLLISEVFYSVLLELGIPFAVSDYSADDQVAALANMYNYPIISNDSDLYILDVPSGFIHLEFIKMAVNSGVDSYKNPYKFLNCKIFYIRKFCEKFPGLDKSTMPLLGTLMGNDFLSQAQLWKFISSTITESTDESLLFNTYNYKTKKIAIVLCWLKNKTLNEAVNEVTSYYKEEQERIKSFIETSLNGYKLNSNKVSLLFVNKIKNLEDHLQLNSKLATPCGNKLPKEFLLKYHQDFSRFFINVICRHKAFLQPQIENANLKSSHACASYIRRIIYGILVRHDINGKECKNQKCLEFIEEYVRCGTQMQTTKVEPLFSVDVIEYLPKINIIHEIPKENCISIIAKVLGISPVFFVGIPNEWKLLVGTINYWLRNPDCRLYSHINSFISAVTLNLIYFGLVQTKYPKHALEICPFKISMDIKCSFCITCIAAKLEKNDLQSAGNVLDKYSIKLSSNHGSGPFLDFTHSFSQLKSCIMYTILLNKLLNNHLNNPNPKNCFSGTLLYNLTNAISSKKSSEILSSENLGKDVKLLFIKLRSKMCENVPRLTVKGSAVRGASYKGK